MFDKKVYSLDKFLSYVLYDKKDGYYENKIPFGEKGDYITSSAVSILFSEMISIFIIIFWKKIGSPKNLNIVEMGGGNGEMICQMIKAFERFDKFFEYV